MTHQLAYFKLELIANEVIAQAHHIVYQAGNLARLPIPTLPCTLRCAGLYFRAALLLQSTDLSLHECCLLWNYYATSSARLAFVQLKYGAIERKKEEAFLLAFEQIKAFVSVSAAEKTLIIC